MRLTASDRESIRARARNGESAASIAQDLGKNADYIRTIIKDGDEDGARRRMDANNKRRRERLAKQ
jgi:IS30 family transposase